MARDARRLAIQFASGVGMRLWNRKRENQAECMEARRLAAEDKRLEGMDPKRAAAIRKYSKQAKQYRLAKYAALTGNFLANS